MRIIRLLLLTVLLVMSGILGIAAKEHGTFSGKLVVEAHPGGKKLKVLQSMTYIDPKGTKWSVPIGTITDGASVPRAFWSIFAPFTGKHRIAAVFHDRYCQTRDRPWRAVHLMFYNAMLASDVDKTSALTMYSAVYAFGPRWSLLGGGKTRAPMQPDLSEQDQREAFEDLQKWIKDTGPTRKQIERQINRIQLRELGSKASFD